MAFETILAREATSSCNPVAVGLFSPLPTTTVTRSKFFLKPWSVGLLVTLAQLAVAVFLLAPEGSFSFRYSSLVQHDGFWFENIVDRGYQTIVPPINHKVMEVSNVAFFPAYPAVASVLCSVFPIESQTALLIVAQLAT